MLVAIPSYIVIRVIAVEFFSHFRFVQNMVMNTNTEDKKSKKTQSASQMNPKLKVLKKAYVYSDK